VAMHRKGTRSTATSIVSIVSIVRRHVMLVWCYSNTDRYGAYMHSGV